jgi:glycosyltransferase involved in cell wall biosynthesis
MRAGFFAPMPPARTGIADYAAALFAAMSESGHLSLNAPGDVNLYHLGNNQLHREIYARAIEHPGIAVLHDAVLHHFFLGSLTQAEYLDEFTYNYDSRNLAHELWTDRARSATDPRYFTYPMLKRIATCSKALIVHNPAAANAVRRQAPDARIFEIPHLFVPPSLQTDTVDIDPHTFLISVFGHMREAKRLPAILRVTQNAWKSDPTIRLLVAGSFASSDLERALRTQLDDPRIIRAGYLAEADFWRYATRTDLCINLRYPSACETSGIAIRLMGIGKSVVFTTGDEIARIPEDACLRVDSGPAEEEMLASTIAWAVRHRDALTQIGANAARHIANEHAIDRCAALYWDALRTA